jgi:hypothetical protein
MKSYVKQEKLIGALRLIASNRSDCGKPSLTRQEMQHLARIVLVECGYSFAKEAAE